MARKKIMDPVKLEKLNKSKVIIDKERKPILFKNKGQLDYIRMSIDIIQTGYLIKILYGKVGDDKVATELYSVKTKEELESFLLEVAMHLAAF